MVFSASAAIIPTDLNSFFAEPPVTVTTDGTPASIAEDPFLFSTLLANDLGLDALNLITPDIGTTLNFSYGFSEAVEEVNEFCVFTVDDEIDKSVGSAFGQISVRYAQR